MDTRRSAVCQKRGTARLSSRNGSTIAMINDQAGSKATLGQVDDVLQHLEPATLLRTYEIQNYKEVTGLEAIYHAPSSTSACTMDRSFTSPNWPPVTIQRLKHLDENKVRRD